MTYFYLYIILIINDKKIFIISTLTTNMWRCYIKNV